MLQSRGLDPGSAFVLDPAIKFDEIASADGKGAARDLRASVEYGDSAHAGEDWVTRGVKSGVVSVTVNRGGKVDLAEARALLDAVVKGIGVAPRPTEILRATPPAWKVMDLVDDKSLKVLVESIGGKELGTASQPGEPYRNVNGKTGDTWFSVNADCRNKPPAPLQDFDAGAAVYYEEACSISVAARVKDSAGAALAGDATRILGQLLDARP